MIKKLPEEIPARMATIHSEMLRLAGLVDIPADWLPPVENDYTQDDYSIVCTDNKTEFVNFERGTTEVKLSTNDLDELLYTVFKLLTFTKSRKYGRENRIAGQDSRRPIFEKNRELFQLLDSNWLKRYDAELNATLASAPFVDK